MARLAALTLLLLAFLATRSRGQDFSLSDALGDDDKKPTTTSPKKPGSDFDLQDALGDGGNDKPAQPDRPKPKPHPKPDQPGTSSDLSDLDLVDGDSGTSHGGGGGGGGTPKGDGDQQADAPGIISGVVGSIVVAVAGAVSTFIAYQKKKMCFKGQGEQGDVNLENQQGPNSKPPAQRSLLEKV